MNKTRKRKKGLTRLPDTQAERRYLEIGFLYLDLRVCKRCRGTDANLKEAVAEVTQVLRAAGVEVGIRKIHVQSEEQARELGFISSPTIRINGRDIQSDLKESSCGSCGDGCGEGVECRIWTYQGREYTTAPKAMIIEAILRDVYGGSRQNVEGSPRTRDVSDNLKRFFTTKRHQENKVLLTSKRCCD
jgi:hypothetical protein